jgi:hypothetical protein
MTSRKIQYWVIPPTADAEFVANMEEVLETYAKPYDPARPVLCMDEQPTQLVKEVRKPIAGTAKRARRVDYEYERAGEHFHVHRTPFGMAGSNGAWVQNENGLGAGSGAITRWSLPAVRQSDSGV